ncbi:Predicted small membrane protein [Phaffia rhodozyma]|uniref:Predicted small membrane protein n=1 Tax=Phaffia rhodozyma TaxID=264483 RepID=A0A0F7SLC3_PHARH|nr:Predicted small membrane protein [Phaffia rhodozyma]
MSACYMVALRNRTSACAQRISSVLNDPAEFRLLSNYHKRMFTPTPQLLWRSGAAIAGTGIMCGAFGAHGLKARVGITPDLIKSWETASHYAFLNGIALMAVSLHPRFGYHAWAGRLIAGGTLLFSGSIFGLVLDREKKFRFLGPITPLGGVAMIAGYAALLF